MDSYQSMLEKISVLQKKASALRENEKKRAVSEMRKLIALYDIEPDELFSRNERNSEKPSPAVGKTTRAKRNVSRAPKYRDPATGKTWIGLGKRPRWLVGDKEAYLISSQEGASESTAKPKKAAPAKAKTTVKTKTKGASKRTVKGSGTPKASTPESPVGVVVAGKSVSESVAE